jgi:vitamin B12 transporter
MFKKITLATLICCLLPLYTHSQSTDTLKLPEIQVFADRFDVSERYRPDFIQHLFAEIHVKGSRATVGDLLQNNHRFLLRSYGPGAAQTAGSQGYSSSQVKVIWNGMEINHSMLGLSDLSLIPAALLSDVIVNSTLGSSEYGANALGGTIILENNVGGDDYFIAGYQYASYGNKSSHFKANKKLGNWHLNLGLVHMNQDNSFKFNDITQNPATIRRRTNAGRNITSGSMNLRYIASNWINSTAFLVTNSKAEIPGPIVAPSTIARQDDVIFRINNMTALQVSKVLAANFRTHFSSHQLDFIDRNSNIESLSQSYNTGSEVNFRFSKSQKIQTRFRLGVDYTWLETSEYEANPLFHSYQQMNGLYTITPRLRAYPSIRYDQYDQFENAISYGLGLNYELWSERLFLIANINRNYSPPTYNDLYWPVLGNRDLRPETANKISTGFRYHLDRFVFSSEYFHSTIDNGILWLPDIRGHFRPNNINELVNSGVSVDTKVGVSYGRTNISGQFGWTYLEARLKDNRYPGESNKGNQLAYHPRNKVTAEFTFAYQNISSVMNYQMIGERYTNDSNSIVLKPVHLLDVSVNYNIAQLFGEIDIGAAILNVTDHDYELIRWYPMPGRTYQFSINLKL